MCALDHRSNIKMLSAEPYLMFGDTVCYTNVATASYSMLKYHCSFQPRCTPASKNWDCTMNTSRMPWTCHMRFWWCVSTWSSCFSITPPNQSHKKNPTWVARRAEMMQKWNLSFFNTSQPGLAAANDRCPSQKVRPNPYKPQHRSSAKPPGLHNFSKHSVILSFECGDTYWAYLKP